MTPGSEPCRKAGELPLKDIIEPMVLLFSGQSVFTEAPNSTPLYKLNRDIKSISHRDSCVDFEKIEQDVSNTRIKIEDIGTGTSQKRHVFYIVHPLNAPYRTDIPAKYYITSAMPEMIGNIRLETSQPRFQRRAFKAMLSAERTASDKPLFEEGTQQLLFDIKPIWKVGRKRYSWNDANGRQVAFEEEDNDKYKLSLTSRMSEELRDALVATWVLRLWHDKAESKQAKREFFEDMTPPELYHSNMKLTKRAGALGALGGAGC
ncbi:hypothetical protein N7475_008090 [Penicillium sp. IBT 31633x]|nr:hypothetical protein N7475_008090 [Penicillium sp. IBT 31633x]